MIIFPTVKPTKDMLMNEIHHLELSLKDISPKLVDYRKKLEARIAVMRDRLKELQRESK